MLQQPTLDNFFITRQGAYLAGESALKKYGLNSFEVEENARQCLGADQHMNLGYVVLLKNREDNFVRYASGDDTITLN